ncbi:MAG: hypothetical protein WB697_23650, partial [Stellaceae bacterium]
AGEADLSEKRPSLPIIRRCYGEVELTLNKLYGRHRMACTHCNSTLDLHEDTIHCLIWVGYRCLFDRDLAIEPDGVVFCLRSDRELTQSG